MCLQGLRIGGKERIWYSRVYLSKGLSFSSVYPFPFYRELSASIHLLLGFNSLSSTEPAGFKLLPTYSARTIYIFRAKCHQIYLSDYMLVIFFKIKLAVRWIFLSIKFQ